MLSIILLLPLANSQTSGSFTYEQQGNNWTGTCATGTAQSPIDIVNSSVTTYEDGDDEYQKAKLTLKDVTGQFQVTTDTSFKLTNVDFGSVEVRGSVFNLFNAHLHAPSEHLINGKQYDLEFHLVGSAASGQFMEFAILYKEGDECPFLKKALDSMDAPYTHNFKDIFGDGDMEDYYYYIGAVTAPPCSENTVWLIYGEVKEASAEQILFFNNLWKNNQNFAQGNGNNKAIKPINGRTIYHYEENALTVMLSAILLLVL